MDEIIDSNNSPGQPISRRKNLIPGVDDAHLALGGVSLTLVALGILSWPNIQDWISKTFKMPPLPLPVSLPNGQPAPANGTAVPPPPAPAVPEQQQEKELPYPYLRRNNIGPVGQAVSVSAMETDQQQRVEQQQPQPQQQKRPQGYSSPFGASISV
jgi:hypothetical protein